MWAGEASWREDEELTALTRPKVIRHPWNRINKSTITMDDNNG